MADPDSNSNSNNEKNKTNKPPPTAREKALVRMFETVTASHWANSGSSREVSDLRPLLLMMDIGSCASAEKHTHVNCVTASMGDVVIEHMPRVGELLELTAAPVRVGSTSLDIDVVVIAHGCTDDQDGGENDAKPTTNSCTRRVCEAFFTYVTTRGPNGEKRYAPPLAEVRPDAKYSDDKKWERTLAQFRRALIRSEQAVVRRQRQRLLEEHEASRNASVSASASAAKPVFESSEVVLPSHQNHMQHLFGGIVMGWMCKSAVAGCVLATRLPLTTFRIRSIQRVDFPEGADVSDHVYFQPRITALFDEGRSAEVEVRVGKRNVTGDETATSHDYDEGEALMNVGYFYVSGVSSYHSEHDVGYRDIGLLCSDCDSGDTENNAGEETTISTLPGSVAPFAGLWKTRSDLYATETFDRTMARERLKCMLARRNLLGGIGHSIRWDASMAEQAPLLTILSVLKLCDESEHSTSPSPSFCSTSGTGTSGPTVWKSLEQAVNIEWAIPDSSTGHTDTFLLRGTTVLVRTKPEDGSSGGLLRDVYATIRYQRPRWDPACLSVEHLERSSASTNSSKSSTLEYGIVEYQLETSVARAKLCLLQACAYLGEDGGVAVTEASSCTAVLASRSVLHEDSDAISNVLPSGWVLKTMDQSEGDGDGEECERLEVTYVAEHDFATVRRSGVLQGMKPEHITEEWIANYVGSFICDWFDNLTSFDHRSSASNSN